MEILYKNKYVTFQYDRPNYILEMIFHAATEDMSVEQYKSDMLICAKLMRESDYRRFLSDLTNFQFVLTPELQDWINKEAFNDSPPMGYRAAIVISIDFVAQVSVEQMTEERPSHDMIRYFATYKEAKEWLLS